VVDGRETPEFSTTFDEYTSALAIAGKRACLMASTPSVGRSSRVADNDLKTRNSVTRISLSLTVAVFAIFAATAITAADQPKFEAASVKPTDRCSVENSVDPGMIRLNGDPLKVILREAFSVKMDQIVGPSWLDSVCFVIVAKIPEGATKDQLPAMFQALLIERFKLAAHKESRIRQGYALLVDKNGPKFKESDPTSHSAGTIRFGAAPGASGIKGAMTMASLARHLSPRLDGPVQDLTELKGKYDIDVSWVPDRSFEPMGPFAEEYAAAHPNAEASLPTGGRDIFAAFRDSLGLRLERRKLQIEVVVIDHIERIPAEN
jgi:uncharacterized protein (TIGR03435 family)